MAKVENLVLVSKTDTTIELAWDAFPGAVSYEVERNAVTVATDVVGTTYTDTGLVAETEYTHRVRGKLVASPLVVTDDFNRADVGPDWTTPPGTNAPIIVAGSLQAPINNTRADMNWAADVFPDDQYAEADLTMGAVYSTCSVQVRNQPGVRTNYTAAFDPNSGGQYYLSRVVNNVWNTLAVKAGVGTAGPRRFRLEVVGSNLELFVDGVSELIASDATYTSGQPGVSFYYTSGTTPTIDNFEAGAL